MSSILTEDKIVHEHSDGIAATSSGASLVVSLANPGVQEVTTAGNTVVVIIYSPGMSTPTAPAGWWAHAGNTAAGLRMYMRGPSQSLADGEFTWTWTLPAGGTLGRPLAWAVFEYEGLASTDEGVGDTGTNGAGLFATNTSGNTAQLLSGQTSTYNGQVVCVHGAYDTASTTPPTWGGHTGGFNEIREQSGIGASTSVGLSISILPVTALGTFGADATVTRSGGGSLDATNFGSLHTVVLNAAGSRKAANLTYIDGAEHGVITNNTDNILTSASAGVSVSTTAKRSGNYGWLLSSTAAACNFVPSLLFLSSSGATPPLRRCFRFPTLPPDGTQFWTFGIATSTFVLRYVSSGQIGLKIGTGTEQVSNSTITANQWFAVDVRPDIRASTPAAAWSVDYNAELTDTTGAVAQTAAAGTASGSGATLTTYTVGWTSSTTATMHTDDGFVGKEYAHYPLGDLRALPLKVDPSGTPVVTGTVGNFGVMTNNGTVTALTGGTLANARNAVDDVPPDLSGTRDAAVAVTASATDWLDFPMETLNMAAQGVNVRGVAWVCGLWAASATTATIRTRASDGTTTYSLLAEVDPSADNSSIVWRHAMLPVLGGTRKDWTQAQVDGLTYGFGSNDATPDIGLDFILMVLAVTKAQPEVLAGSPGDPYYVEAHRDPDTQGLVGFTVNTDGSTSVTVDWEDKGVPGSTGVIGPSSSTYQALSAGSDATLTDVSLTITPS